MLIIIPCLSVRLLGSAPQDRKALDALIPDVARLCKVLDALANRLKQECTRRQDLEVALSQQDQSDEGLEAELDEVELRIVEGLYVMQQLLQLSRYSDLQDEAGRKQLAALLGRSWGDFCVGESSCIRPRTTSPPRSLCSHPLPLSPLPLRSSCP